MGQGGVKWSFTLLWDCRKGFNLAFESHYLFEDIVYVIRRGLDQYIRVRDYPSYRGESSHYTLPRVVSMCRPKGLV